LNKLKLASGFDHISEFMDENNIELLPISFLHIQGLLSLDFHHRDPFDRIIIAQAKSEDLIILTKDKEIAKYDIRILWD
jgi:PIN domain nuclease of toxin-antitoxin system